jgi:hypothetical protein
VVSIALFSEGSIDCAVLARWANHASEAIGVYAEFFGEFSEGDVAWVIVVQEIRV